MDTSGNGDFRPPGNHCHIGGDSMTAVEVAKIAGVSVARVWQFCRQYKLNPQNISREDCNKLIARKHRKVKGNA